MTKKEKREALAFLERNGRNADQQGYWREIRNQERIRNLALLGLATCKDINTGDYYLGLEWRITPAGEAYLKLLP